MRNPQGYAIWTDPERPAVERDTFTCAHCGRIVFVAPRAAPTDLGGWCGCCAKPICGPCADKPLCTPLEKWLDQQERRQRFAVTVGLQS